MKNKSRILHIFLFSFLFTTYTAIGQCWKQVTAGHTFIMALKDDGTIWGWGTNINGQLGLGPGSNSIIPINKAVQMGTDNDWDSIVSCQNSTLARKSDGTLWGWGLNGDGELGIGSFVQQLSPVLVSSASDWKYIASGRGAHVIAIKSDGTLWGWGANHRGQLGIVNTNDQSSPVQISASTDWKKVACGFVHTIALKTDGTIWGWGNNVSNQVSNTAAAGMQTTPIQIGVANDWADISAGEDFSVAVKTNGTLWSWGTNINGQLGVGNTSVHTTQMQVGTDTDWLSVFAGLRHTVAAKTDSSLWGWGSNAANQLGHNTNPQISPAALGIGNVDWKAIVPGYLSTLVLKTDESIWASGAYPESLLGNNDPTTHISTFMKAGPLNYPAYTPALGGGSALLTKACDSDYQGYNSYGTDFTLNRRLFAIHPNGNTGNFTITYDSSRNTNTTPLVQTDATHATSLMGRLVTITYSGTLDEGITLRFYYNATDSTNTSNALDSWISAHPGTIKRWHWVKYDGDAAALVSGQIPTGFSGGHALGRSDTSDSENGVRFAEFRGLKGLSTFAGFAYANITNTPFPDVSLPITLKHFTASPKGMTTLLRWITAIESNNKGFAIERSSNSADWQTIGYVPSLAPDGNSFSDIRYSYTDKTPTTGANYYRLKQEDKDGKTSYTRIIAVTFRNDNVITVFPNPAKESFYVAGMNGGETVSIYTVFGQLQRSEIIPGKGTYQISLEGLSKAMYIVKVVGKTTEIKTFKMLVQ